MQFLHNLPFILFPLLIPAILARPGASGLGQAAANYLQARSALAEAIADASAEPAEGNTLLELTPPNQRRDSHDRYGDLNALIDARDMYQRTGGCITPPDGGIVRLPPGKKWCQPKPLDLTF